MQGYHCATCGQYHEKIPLSFGADAPYSYEEVPEAEREARTFLSSDQCVIDDRWFFVRGVLEIPIVGTEEVFTWGVWASLSEKNFERITVPPTQLAAQQSLADSAHACRTAVQYQRPSPLDSVAIFDRDAALRCTRLPPTTDTSRSSQPSPNTAVTEISSRIMRS